MMDYLILTDFKWLGENSTPTASGIISQGKWPERHSQSFYYRGHEWEVRIQNGYFETAATVPCFVRSISSIKAYDAVKEYIRLTIVENSLKEKLLSMEKKFEFKFSVLSKNGSENCQLVLEGYLDRMLVDKLGHGDCSGKRDFTILLEFIRFDKVAKRIVGGTKLVPKESAPRPKEVVPDNDWKELSENILFLFLYEDDCDVTLNVSRKSFKAHRNILSTRSPVFNSMFKYDLKEKRTGTVDIPDCDPGAFEAYLHYLYSGNFDTITVDNVRNLHRISDKYGSKTLVRRCRRFMMDNLSVDKFGEFVSVILNDLDASSFLEAAISFFADNLEGIGESEAWKEFLEHKPLQANELMIKAHKIFASRRKK